MVGTVTWLANIFVIWYHACLNIKPVLPVFYHTSTASFTKQPMYPAWCSVYGDTIKSLQWMSCLYSVFHHNTLLRLLALVCCNQHAYQSGSRTKHTKHLTLTHQPSLSHNRLREKGFARYIMWHRRTYESFSSLIMRTEVDLKISVQLPFDHLIQLLAQQSFTEFSCHECFTWSWVITF